MKGRLYFNPMVDEFFIITEDKENINITDQLNDLVGSKIELIIRKDYYG